MHALNILVADDDATLRNAIRMSIEQRSDLDAAVETAGTIEEVRAAYSRTKYDVAFVDYHWPDDGGRALASELLAAQQHAFVIVMTANHSAELPHADERRVDLLPKPFDHEMFHRVLDHAIAKRAVRPVDDRPTKLAPEAKTLHAKQAEDWILGCLQSTARYARDHWGEARLSEIATKAGLTVKDIEDGVKWVSTETIGRFFEGVFDALGRNEAAFKKAVSYRLNESYGAYRYVLWTMSPGRFTRLAVENIHLVASVCDYTLTEVRPGVQRLRYANAKNQEEHRTLCLMRQANYQTMPTFWGLPPAMVEETSCIARGDPYCEYIGRYVTGHRPMLPLAGAGLGLLALSALHTLWPTGYWTPLLGMASGLLLGRCIDMQRVNRANLLFAQESRDAIQDLADQESAARRELASLRESQAQWTDELERRIQDRTISLYGMIADLRKMQSHLTSDVRGLGHDIQSPLSTLRLLYRMFSEGKLDRANPDLKQVFNIAIERLDGMIDQLVRHMRKDSNITLIKTERIDIPALAQHIEAQLRATNEGRHLHVSVMREVDTPAYIMGDTLVLSRIIDNLISNAFKNTAKGEICVHLQGEEQFLTITVTDTGEGIPRDQIRTVFLPSDKNLDHGLGLSITARLLHEIGGRLSVTSRVGHGSRFKAFIPQKPACAPAGHDQDISASIDHIVDSVVEIPPE